MKAVDLSLQIERCRTTAAVRGGSFRASGAAGFRAKARSQAEARPSQQQGKVAPPRRDLLVPARMRSARGAAGGDRIENRAGGACASGRLAIVPPVSFVPHSICSHVGEAHIAYADAADALSLRCPIRTYARIRPQSAQRSDVCFPKLSSKNCLKAIRSELPEFSLQKCCWERIGGVQDASDSLFKCRTGAVNWLWNQP